MKNHLVLIGFIVIFVPTVTFSQDSRFIFTDLTVMDKVTGLIWTKNANLPGKELSYKDTLDFIKKLNNQKFAVYGDWRLPDKEELKSLVDYAKGRGLLTNIHEMLNRMGFENMEGDPGYWTASYYTISVLNDGAWSIAMYNGYTSPLGKLGRLYVWPVREPIKQ